MGAKEKIDGSRGFKSKKKRKTKLKDGFKSKSESEYGNLINTMHSVLPKLTHQEFKQLKKIVHKQFLKKFARARVTSVDETTFERLAENDRMGHESFESNQEMYKTYSKYYNVKITPNTKVKIIEFKLIGNPAK